MEFLHSFIPVLMKYDFISQNYGPNVATDWSECRVNVKPNVTKRCIRITVYPNGYNETVPDFVLDINGSSTIIDCGPVKSRSKVNVYGVIWSDEQYQKCRIFIAFDNKRMRHNFSKYFKELLKLYSIDSATNTENDCENKSPMCNEAVRMTSNSSHHHHQLQQTNASSKQIMCVSNASGSCEDVVLRPKPADAAQNRNRRLVRSLAAISGLFKSIRDSGGINQKKNDENSTKASPTTTKTKRKTWNIFKLKEKQPCDMMPSFQHFQEPLNIERPSLARGNIDITGYSDVEWYDLNKDEMSVLEARASNIVSDFNSYNQISSNRNSDSGGNSIAESSNTLRSRNNLSTSCKSNDENCIPETQTNPNGKQKHSTRTQSIRSKKSVAPTISIDDIMTKSIAFDLDCNYNFDESYKLSSGFGSGESDTNSPREFVRKFKAFADSPTTRDFFEKAFSSNQSNDDLNECLPSTATTTTAVATYGDATIAQVPIVKNMQKTSKKHHIQINSRKLFGIQNEVHTPSSPANVTPQNKSPTECRTKKVRTGTPFKIRSMKQKQMYVTEV